MKITDVRVLAALAHPTRLAILHLLLTVGDSTATRCAAVVGESPSACSYHLRYLEGFGLVERVEADPGDAVDGRTRRWRSVATGFDFGEPDRTGSPELVAATVAVTSIGIDENVRLARHYLSHLDDVPTAWQGVAAFSSYALLVNRRRARARWSTRSMRLSARCAARPALTRRRMPRPVRMALEAFPRTDLA